MTLASIVRNINVIPIGMISNDLINSTIKKMLILVSQLPTMLLNSNIKAYQNCVNSNLPATHRVFIFPGSQVALAVSFDLFL
jgi:hypothetical protein